MLYRKIGGQMSQKEIETHNLEGTESGAPEVVHYTWRSVLVGCGLGGAVAAMNAYFGLRTGWTVGGSLIAAILGYSFFAILHPKVPVTPLEINLTQTSGSAAGEMTAAAGFISAIPALGMLGFHFSYLELFCWAMAVAYIGVFYAVPLRRQMVLVEQLRFPSGTATAETIKAMFSAGGDAIEKSRTLVAWGIGGAVFTVAAFFIPQVASPPMEWIGLGALGAWTLSLYISPMMTGAGLLIGPRVGLSLLAGAIIAWGLLGPYVQSQGWATEPILEYHGGPRGWILWPGVAIMVADAMATLGLSWRSVVNTFKRTTPVDALEDTAPDSIPNSWWIIGLGLSTISTTLVAWIVFDIPPYFTVLAIILSAVLSAIAVRATGETDINPIGGMGKVTQLVFGGLAPGAMATNLMSAAVTASGASQAADLMQDLKTGHLLGASPRAQFKAQILGIFFGVLFSVAVYALFDTVYDIGGTEVPAPAAHAWKAMAEVLSKGFDALPPHSEWAVAIGFFFGVLLPVLRKYTRLAPYLPSGMAFGIAFIVPAYYSITMCIGAIALVVWRRVARGSADRLAFSVASGLVAGEGLMGIVIAILRLFGLEPLT